MDLFVLGHLLAKHVELMICPEDPGDKFGELELAFSAVSGGSK